MAQVNTERMRKTELKNGLSSSAKLDFGVISGNSDFLKLRGGLRSDFTSGKYYIFGVIDYSRGFQDDELFINKGFVHFRCIRELDRMFQLELFTQIEFDDFIKLRRRSLAGGGLRLTLLSGNDPGGRIQPFELTLGTGYMWENEEIDTSPPTETSIFRSTNYISFTWRFDERVYLGAVTYYQVYLKDPGDYRVLVESGFGFDVTSSVTFRLTFGLRFDNEPPAGVRKHDLEINNGITFAF